MKTPPSPSLRPSCCRCTSSPASSFQSPRCRTGWSTWPTCSQSDTSPPPCSPPTTHTPLDPAAPVQLATPQPLAHPTHEGVSPWHPKPKPRPRAAQRTDSFRPPDRSPQWASRSSSTLHGATSPGDARSAAQHAERQSIDRPPLLDPPSDQEPPP